MKYLMLTFALLIVGMSLLCPPSLQLFPERPYHGPYAGGEANLPVK